jgi:type I restriction enzyme S subunit
MSFIRYPEYRESGVESVERIPIHWTLRRIRSITSIQKGRLPKNTSVEPSQESDLPYLTMEYLRGNEENTPLMYIPIEEQSIIAKKGDTLVLWDGSNAGEFLKAKNGVVSSTLAIIKNISIDKDYLFYGLKSIEKNLKDQTVGMGIPHVSNDILRNLVIHIPSDNEQEQIVKFLDQEIYKIDSLVNEQKKLIKLLNEKRQAVISHVVTKGIDPNVKMKDSGVEWLGEIPEHWDLKRIANLYSEFNEGGDESLPILSVSIHRGVSDKEFEDDEMERKVIRSDDRSKYKKVQTNDLVYNMMRAWQGGFGAVKVNGMVSPAYVVARPKIKLITSYFENVLRTPQAIEQMRRYSRGVTDFRLRLYWEEFKNLQLPVPTISEMIEICEKITKMCEKFDALTDACESSIDLLLERRSALISATVTGQIDVRNYQPKEIS